MLKKVIVSFLVLILVSITGIYLFFKVTGPSNNPDGAMIITEDIERFWSAYDISSNENLTELLQTEYIDKGTPGLKGFLPNRIISSKALAATVEQNLSYYKSARNQTLKVAAYESQIRSAFHKLKELYPDAVFPDVYFVIGRMNSGGTTSHNALIIGTEMYGLTESFPIDSLSEWHQAVLSSPDKIPLIVTHELIHFQQPFVIGKSSLLSASIKEGAADFITELITGSHINNHIHNWANPREDSLWNEFKTLMHGTDYSGWLYNGVPSDGKPADLGYWMGYKIVEAYYNKSTDKKAAILKILRNRDSEEFLLESGY